MNRSLLTSLDKEATITEIAITCMYVSSVHNGTMIFGLK